METMINTYLLLAWMQLSGFYPSNAFPGLGLPWEISLCFNFFLALLL